MDPDNEVQIDCPPIFRLYKSGRVERFLGTATVPASVDPTTGVTSKDVTIDSNSGVSARLYLPNLANTPQKKVPILIHYHGGAFCIESAFSPTYHTYLNSLVAQAHLLTVSVNYRLAPEHLLPAAYDDSWAALKWVASHAEDGGGTDSWLTQHGDFRRVFIAGDSAGGNIAHQMALAAGADGLGFGVRIEGMALVHPYFWGTEPIGSETREPEKRAWIEGLWKAVSLPGMEVDDPRFNPVGKGAPSLAGLGCERVMVCVGEKDLLRERGRAYYECLKGSGWRGVVELLESEGEEHVFHLQRPGCEKALELTESLVSFFIRE